MTLTLPFWGVPLALTMFIWAWGILMPMPQKRGDYDFGPALSGAFRLAVCVVCTLLFWLIYFIIKSST